MARLLRSPVVPVAEQPAEARVVPEVRAPPRSRWRARVAHAHLQIHLEGDLEAEAWVLEREELEPHEVRHESRVSSFAYACEVRCL